MKGLIKLQGNFSQNFQPSQLLCKVNQAKLMRNLLFLPITSLNQTQPLQSPQILHPSPITTSTRQQVDDAQLLATPTGKQVEDTQPKPTAQSPATKSQPSSIPDPPLCTANPFEVLGTLEEEDPQVAQLLDAQPIQEGFTNTGNNDPIFSTPTNIPSSPPTTQKNSLARTPTIQHNPVPSPVQDRAASTKSITPHQKNKTSSPCPAGFLDKAFASGKNPLGYSEQSQGTSQQAGKKDLNPSGS
ncbi:hypothetical protein FRX31_017759 [Thalictrum thalictroides]|uniref:Uncharacterized protein n=1 Tax=Thalictrum thalictroides TaxID=46969 RepID=A0A7J6W5K1_THATH|nr:hypothetical protein FRX31_017759 [Thalictrum thalictroides]